MNTSLILRMFLYSLVFMLSLRAALNAEGVLEALFHGFFVGLSAVMLLINIRYPTGN